LYGETAAALAEVRAAPGGPPPAPAPVRDLAGLLAVCLARIGLARERVRDAGAAADLAVAEEAAWRAAEGIREVLGFAPGRREAVLAPLDLGAAARAAVVAARARWPVAAAGVRLELDLEPTPPVRGRPEELAEALAHLLDNAAEAVPAGGEIRVRARWDGGRRVELAVEDTGPGMDEAVRGRALEPFFTTRGPGRLGLGLAVVQAIVTRHEGTLELTSAPGRGTTVCVALPPASATRGGPVPGPTRVLVIEDDAAIREALVALLRDRGYIALAAADGPAGLAVVEREPVDVVFTDLAVAQVSGFDVARAVKRLRPGTPVVLVTGWPGRLDEADVAGSGIDRVIEKPVGAAEMLAALDAALSGRRPSPA
jgi:CheY-like chemotaxis protein